MEMERREREARELSERTRLYASHGEAHHGTLERSAGRGLAHDLLSDHRRDD